jgi:hypothetical protein
MVDTLLRLQKEWGMNPISRQVEQVLREVPRHVFVPEVPLEDAYATDYAPPIQRAEDGLITSSMSAVRVQAMMLDHAGLEPGGYVGVSGEHLSMSSSIGHAFTGVRMSMSSNSTQHAKAARGPSGGWRTDGPAGQLAAARVWANR